MPDPLKIGLVYGSPRRFCDTVAGWVAERVRGDSRFVLHPVRLAWWARALRDARLARAYGAAA